MSTALTSSRTRLATDRLPRRLGVASTAAVLIGVTIGSGIFRAPSIVATQLESVTGIALVWLTGAAITLAGALTLVGLATALPRAGGAYAFMREGYGPLVAFLFGWIKLLVTGPASLAAISLIFAEYARAFAPLSDRQVQLVACALLVALTAANIRSVSWSATLQNVSTVTKVLALTMLSLLIFSLGVPGTGALSPPIAWNAVNVSGFWTALIVVLWTYTGWVDLTYIAGEVRDPVRTYPRAVLGGMTIILVVYLLVNAAYLYVLPLSTMAQSTLVGAAAAERVLGAPGASFVAALVMVSTFGALNGTILTNPRVFFSLAEDGLFFRSVAAVHPRYHTPYVALVLYMLLGVAGVATRTFQQLAEMFVLGIWPFYALAVGAVFLVPRRRPDLAPLCRAWGYPVLPAAFLLFSVAMLGAGVVRRPFETALSFGIILLGIPAYFSWVFLRNRRVVAPAAASDSVER